MVWVRSGLDTVGDPALTLEPYLEPLFAFQYLEPQYLSPLHLLLIEFPLDTHLSLDLSHRVFL